MLLHLKMSYFGSKNIFNYMNYNDYTYHYNHNGRLINSSKYDPMHEYYDKYNRTDNFFGLENENARIRKKLDSLNTSQKELERKNRRLHNDNEEFSRKNAILRIQLQEAQDIIKAQFESLQEKSSNFTADNDEEDIIIVKKVDFPIKTI